MSQLQSPSSAGLVVRPLVGVAVALLGMAVLIASTGVNPLRAYAVLLDAALGSAHGVGLTLSKVAPLLLAGLGVALARHGNLWNIGAEGQIFLGGLGAALVGLFVPLPGPLHLLAALAAGAAMGALWGALPGFLLAKRRVNEVISTLLLNYVGIAIVAYAVEGPLKEPGAAYARSARFPSSVTLPPVFGGPPLHAGILLALIAAAAVYLYVYRSRSGFELRLFGGNPETARQAGISPDRKIVTAMTGSGLLAGLAGAGEVLGVHKNIAAGFSPGFGFDAIAVALLGLNDPRGVIPAAIFFGILRAGAPAMQRGVGVSSDLVVVTQGVAIFAVILSMVAPRMFTRRPSRSVADSGEPSLVSTDKDVAG